MSKPDTRLERMDDIERKLAQRPKGASTGELAREYGVNVSTIRRDFMIMQSMGTAVEKKGRRYLLNRRRALHQVKFTNNEVLALYLAARLLSRHSDEHNPHVITVLEKLADVLKNKSPLMSRHIEQAAAAVRGRQARPEYLEALEALTEGWAEGRKVWLCYRSFKNEITERIFAPYFIDPSGIGYACYAIGYDDLRGDLRTLKIERISQARLTDERFTIPATFDPHQMLASAWGIIWRDEGHIEVSLRFQTPQVVRRIKESTWHHSQRIEDLPDGSCLFTVYVGSTMELKPWVRQWGADVEVISPPKFREEMIEEVRQMAKAYGVLEP